MQAMRQGTEQRQQTALSPKLQQAVRLLQLSSLDFAQEVHQALERNPFLEPIEDGSDDESVPNEQRVDDDEGDGERELWQVDGLGRQPHGEATDGSALELMAAPSSLAQQLHAQLRAQPLPERDSLLAHAIVDSLDDDGYLRTPLDELIGVVAPLSPPPTAGEMALALQRVQSLDPAGVGARSVAECLRLQLPSVECALLRDRAETVIEQHLGLLAARDMPALARALSCSADEAAAVCERIRQFDPHPGWRHASDDVHYVIPDVIVRKRRGQWAAQLNPTIVPRVRVNEHYAQLFARAKDRAGAHAEMADQLQQARWTLRNVEQRFSTIQSVAESIVRRQKSFFDHGPMAIRPLGLHEIAEELGMHESTVSRVTNNKFMATTQGVFELKYFFSRAMTSANGGAFSGTAIRELVREMVEAEPARAPLSDVEIARRLARQGLTVARRTVTKYRQMLRIEAVERRRRTA